MLEVLAYLYETYYRPELFPEMATLSKTLAEVGFKETEIEDALNWLDHLAETTETFAERHPERDSFSSALRVYAPLEQAILGPEAIGFILSLETAGILDPVQREIVIERALDSGISPVPVEKLRLVVLFILWSQGEDTDIAMLHPAFTDNEIRDDVLLH
jgi:Smg protein